MISWREGLCDKDDLVHKYKGWQGGLRFRRGVSQVDNSCIENLNDERALTVETRSSSRATCGTVEHVGLWRLQALEPSSFAAKKR